MQLLMKRIFDLEEEMKAEGALVYSARLHGPADAKVVRSSQEDALITDGPFAETKEQIAGFYILEASDIGAALDWASRVTGCISKPIEVRPIQAMHGV